ncbi:DUF2283 domain-containing protein [Turneriella parva]|jgi:uncharacterized protein YuzE|uniref:DUF2283 domain-containing protein n=1 Tax=Turneriella parva (strain ATCC BAA-1111 / DSM 21527 / NCTC 11395 / H) TaxID=869212 RepID=I4B9N3_TURPD|nr:DUF2283 domain-containing protein [Turneriella parva]AFM13990.1 Protein of unknown function DUF2283 [Turneriella parva DSM 21527]
MKISYDEKYDTMYIKLIDEPVECRTLQLSEDVALNIGPNEKLVGIEILDAKQVIGHGKVPSVVLDNLKQAVA